MAVGTQGITVEVETTPGGGTFTVVGEVQSFDGPTSNKPEIEITHFGSTAKEYIPGLPDYGTITLAMNFTDPEDAGQAILRANFEAASSDAILFQATLGTIVITFNAFVSEYPIAAQTDSKIDQNATLRVTGQPTRS